MNSRTKNIWTLDKDLSIRAILIMLQQVVGPEGFMLLDEDKLNEKAVRIISSATRDELSAYVYSYAQREGRYGLDLEFPFLIETRADDQTIRLNDLTAEEVVEKIITHLEIKQ
jgi:hypothetical protein